MPTIRTDIPIGTWKSLNTNVASRSYQSLVQYLSGQCSSLSPDTPSRGGKAFGATDGSSTTDQGQGRKRKRNRGKGGKGTGDGKSTNPKRQQRQQQAPQAHAIAAASDESHHRTVWNDDQSALAGQLHQWNTGTPSVSSVGSEPGAQRRVKTTAHRFYCTVHGYNTTHNGNVCRPMLDDPTTYTAQHLQAQKPSDCNNPAGNENVQALRPRLH
jgi:hypothetical protein